MDKSNSCESGSSCGGNQKRNVLVTGFGPFRNHELNPSWEAIKDGRIKIEDGDADKYNLIVKQIDVSYKEVDEVVTKLCKQLEPAIIIHIGLSYAEKSIRLEERARCGPYIDDDVRKFAPHTHFRVYKQQDDSDGNFQNHLEENTIKHKYSRKPCDEDEFACYQISNLNLDKLCDKMNQLHQKGLLNIPTSKSSDAGLYLCEYIYQNSLKLCRIAKEGDECGNKGNKCDFIGLKDSKCLFIHIPPTERFPLEDITACIQQVVNFLIHEVELENRA